MSHPTKNASVVAGVLTVLAASGETSAGVTNVDLFAEAYCYVVGKDVFDSVGTGSNVFRSFKDFGSVDRTADGPGASSFGYRLDLPEANPASGRFRIDAAIADRGWTESSIIGSGSWTSWNFRTNEHRVLELQGLHAWSGDSITHHRTEIGLFGPGGRAFAISTSDQRTDINAAIDLPPGLWSLRVSTSLAGNAVENGPGFAAQSSLDLDFRIIPAPSTLAPLLALSLVASRRKR